MNNTLAKFQALINKDYIIYVIWDVKKGNFYRHTSEYSRFGYGVFVSSDKAETSAEKFINNPYEIIDVSIKDSILPELQAVADLELGDDLILIKFRQLVEVFVFRNEKLIDHLREQYNGRQS